LIWKKLLHYTKGKLCYRHNTITSSPWKVTSSLSLKTRSRQSKDEPGIRLRLTSSSVTEFASLRTTTQISPPAFPINIFWCYRGSPEQRPLEEDLMINNEETLEDLLRRFISPVVNYALENQLGRPHLGRGSRFGSDRSDWSVISAQCIDGWGRFENVLPGDTKLDAKWRPTMIDEGPGSFVEWQKVVAQVVTYMAKNHTRYGFILTDGFLVPLRLTREPVAAGIAQERPRRDIAAASHQRHTSDMTMASGGGSASPYSDNNGLDGVTTILNTPLFPGNRTAREGSPSSSLSGFWL